MRRCVPGKNKVLSVKWCPCCCSGPHVGGGRCFRCHAGGEAFALGESCKSTVLSADTYLALGRPMELHRWMLTPSVTSTAAVDIGVLHSAVLSVSAGRAREGALQISLIKNPRLSAHDDPLARAPCGELACHVGSTVPSCILRSHAILEFHLHAI